MNRTILIADDEKDLCTILADSFSRDRYRVLTAHDGKTALQLAKTEQPDVILLDIRMPVMDGIETLGEIKRMEEEMPVIIFTGYGTIETARKAMKLGAYDYVTKPVDLFLLKSLVKEILDKKKKRIKKRKQ
jgi:DNA-binding NtrC family response regulator